MAGESARFGTSRISLFIQNYKNYSRMDDIMCVCVCVCVCLFSKVSFWTKQNLNYYQIAVILATKLEEGHWFDSRSNDISWK